VEALTLWTVAVILCCALSPGCERPASNSAPAAGDLQTRLNSYLNEQIQLRKIPGLSVAVVHDGRAIYLGAAGVRKLGEGEKVTPRHVFHLASISKTFAATAVMQLVEQGKLNLDDPLTKALPYFRLADSRYKGITIRQMLNHTAGLPPGDTYEWDRPQFDEGAAERYVRSLASQQLLWAPGDGWQYSDLGPDIMADVVAKVSGLSFEAFVKANVFEPLGMASSSFIPSEIDAALRTTGHVDNPARVSNLYPYNRRHAPSSTLTSSVSDMTRWMLANLNRGELDGRRILRSSSYDALWTPTRQIPREKRQIGLSWFIREHSGHRLVEHGGGDIGFRSYIWLFPDDRLGIVMASNWQETPREILMEEIFALLKIDEGRR
jgi:CubicO group peptidase (beta-lactamase class C family)